ncbi:MAG: response regulator transcription factor [Nitrospirales bacterium]|nr:response regulator transcription factor [Nitrospira sp.]MDR4501394.1 response regulator transcription factor [Nitrospirales bacterium]
MEASTPGILKPPIKILIVDDHEVVRLGIRNVLERVPGYQVVGQASCSEEALAYVKQNDPPDLILLDIRLPDQDGFLTCQKILTYHPSCRVLFLSSFVNPAFIQQAVIAGAYGYVLKAVGSKSLLESIAQVVRGESTLDPLALQEIFAWLRQGQGQGRQDLIEKLSEQERAILTLVSEGKTNKEIASHIHVSESTVKNYLGKIFEKLGVTRRAEAAAMVTKAMIDQDHLV